MRDAEALFDLYTQGARLDALGRAALLGGLVAGEDARTLPLGELDRRIWRLREEFSDFGANATEATKATEAACHCPECGARLEFAIPEDFTIPAAAADHATLAFAGNIHHLRMPTLGDFGPEGLRKHRLGDGPWEDAEFAARAADALRQSDPALGFALAMRCPDCGADFEQPFDPSAFCWAEIEEWALQLVTEVTRLAAAFGWSERAILAMAPGRRALYLAEVGA